MRISAIKSYQTNPHFNGEGSNKTNKLKNAAGAAAIALASVVPVEEAEAQIYYYPPIVPSYAIPAPPTINLNPVPNCFIVGDNSKVNYNKSMRRVFNELDTNESGTISSREVLKTESNNWNRYNILYPFNSYQAQHAEAQFNALSEAYNEEDSNPNTINYNEYKAIMNDYMEAKQISDFVKLFTLPGIMYPPPPPCHHHHHHHRHHRH
jgi:hypothetical protein